MLVTRFAPTPSGYLHPGNLVNLTLTQWLARTTGGRLLLRIDDFDRDRVRRAYLEDVFRTLEWLDVDIHDGPTGVADFEASWSLPTRMARYLRARDRLMATAGHGVFVCGCSRSGLGPDGRCVAGCATRGLTLAQGRTVLRLRVDDVTSDAAPSGDTVLWRRDDLPAYHLGSVVDDEAAGITAVVRGMDLLASSRLQRHLAALLPAPGFLAADLRHHELLAGVDGAKLSKSAGAQAQPLAHTAQLRRQVLAHAGRLAGAVGIERP